MRVYVIQEQQTALRLATLIKLNAECVRVHWSKMFSDIPQEVRNALEDIETYVEEEVENSNAIYTKDIPAEEENALMALLKKNPMLRNTLGTGVVMEGEQAREVRRMVEKERSMDTIVSALASGKNIVIF